MPDDRLDRTRRAYRIDFDSGDGPTSATVRCICGSPVDGPHAPECYRLKRDYLTDCDPADETPWAV